jgi:divalent metal cation (Fe/Co/Zn/Cd) transporter
LAVGGMVESSAVFGDAVHNTADTASHALHTSTHKAENQLNNGKKRNAQIPRRIAAGMFAIGAAIAGYEAYNSIKQPPENNINNWALSFELGVLCMNGYFLRQVIKNNDRTLAAHDSKNHHLTDTIVSSVAVAGIAANPATGWSDGAAGYFAAGATALLSTEILLNSYGKNGPLHKLYNLKTSDN